VVEVNQKYKKGEAHDSTMTAGLSNIYPYSYPITNTK
jgi:hypothetical protein